jgi:hypothetical protein
MRKKHIRTNEHVLRFLKYENSKKKNCYSLSLELKNHTPLRSTKTAITIPLSSSLSSLCVTRRYFSHRPSLPTHPLQLIFKFYFVIQSVSKWRGQGLFRKKKTSDSNHPFVWVGEHPKQGRLTNMNVHVFNQISTSSCSKEMYCIYFRGVTEYRVKFSNEKGASLSKRQRHEIPPPPPGFCHEFSNGFADSDFSDLG